jgi:DNA-binding XRE family transcriptional regulator
MRTLITVENLGGKIRRLRFKEKESQRELASKLGVSASCLSLWEKGKQYPSLLALIRICNHFQIKMDDMLFVS